MPVIALETGCDYGEATMSNIVYFPHMQLDIGLAVAQVISHVGWLNVALIYDEQTGGRRVIYRLFFLFYQCFYILCIEAG